MADVSAHTPIFSRGSTVLDYWLVHGEGMMVEPIGARVEEVVVGAPIGRAEALIVRSRITHRLRSIPADSIVAVEPSAGHFLLDATESRVRLATSSKHGLRVAQQEAIRGARWTHASTRFALTWLRPRIIQASSITAQHSRIAVARTGKGVAWLAPRVTAGARVACATGARWMLAAAVIVARGAARTAREIERAAALGAERGRTSLELRRARKEQTPDE